MKRSKKNKKTKKVVSEVKIRFENNKPKINLTKIKVVGVGGGGGNAVSRMMSSEKMRGVEFIAINTDAQDLNTVFAHQKLYIGRALTKGLGAGMNPEIGRQAAEENRSEIAEILDGADIVFITAGFGGGTGTGASPVIAEIAREKGILTIGVITKPFTFEGIQRMNIALEGIARFKDKVDALVVIPNDRIFNIIDKDTSLLKAFGYIDEILKNAVQAVADIINLPGIINVDFADIKAVMKDAGQALVGVGYASGPDRALKAAELAINSPLLEVSIEGAKGVLLSIAGGRDLKMMEINEIAAKVSENVDNNARIIFGAYHDNRIKDKQIKVTVIATGFNGFTERKQMPNLFLFTDKDLIKGSVLTSTSSSSVKILKKEEKKQEKGGEDKEIKDEKEIKQDKENKGDKEDKEDFWEVPTFLRRKRK